MPERQDRGMQITEGELLAMTKDLDQVHHATLPVMAEAMAEWREVNDERRTAERGRRGPSRRSFLMGSGTAVGTMVLAACSKSNSSASSGTTTSAPGGANDNANPYQGDLALAALAASLENLTVQTYQAGLDAAGSGRLGTVPNALTAFATAAKNQHNDHAGAWNSVLASAGKPIVTQVDSTVKAAVVTPGLAKVTDGASLAKLALGLEDAAAATYLNAIQNVLAAQSAIKIAAIIQPVEMQHSAILHFVLGDYPVPDSFAKTDGARGPSDKLG